MSETVLHGNDIVLQSTNQIQLNFYCTVVPVTKGSLIALAGESNCLFNTHKYLKNLNITHVVRREHMNVLFRVKLRVKVKKI